MARRPIKNEWQQAESSGQSPARSRTRQYSWVILEQLPRAHMGGSRESALGGLAEFEHHLISGPNQRRKGWRQGSGGGARREDQAHRASGGGSIGEDRAREKHSQRPELLATPRK